MKAFLIALFLFSLTTGGVICYSVSITNLGGEWHKTLSALPETEPKSEEAHLLALDTCEALIAEFEEHELFLHLGIPYERIESLHETILEMRAHLKSRDFDAYCAARALAIEETEILHRSEEVTLENLL